MSEPTDFETTVEYRGNVVFEASPVRRPVRVEFASLSDPGRVRANNEDHYLLARMERGFRVVATNVAPGELPEQVDEIAYGMVIADGMGGMAAGEKASQLAIKTGVELVLKSPKWATRIDEEEARQLIGRMRDYFRKVDIAVFGEGAADRHLRGMGTTLTIAYSVGVDVFIVHVGDSRAYLFRGGKLEQLTRDHTMAQGLAEAGVIKPEEIHRHATRNVLTNFVGGPTPGVDPEIATLQVRGGDVLFLCSDGLTDMVSDDEIARVLDATPSAPAAVRALVDLALENGGRDNVTVIMARFEIPAES